MVGGSDGARAGPRFSVVVPAYNESAFLGECLQSLASQDFSGTYEVIVIDNNSTDQTAKIARLHGATVVGEQHPGVCWARPVSYTHLRAHETRHDLVCRLL